MSHQIDSYDNKIYDICSNRTFTNMIFTDSVAQSGDSGGPWYDYDQWDDEILMSHHTAGGYDSDGDGDVDVTFGAAAYALHNNLGYRFDTASDLQCS